MSRLLHFKDMEIPGNSFLINADEIRHIFADEKDRGSIVTTKYDKIFHVKESIFEIYGRVQLIDEYDMNNV